MATPQPRTHTHYIAAFALVAIAAVFVFLSNPGDRITRPALAAPNFATDWTKDPNISHPGGVPQIFKKITTDHLGLMCVLKFDGTVWCWGGQDSWSFLPNPAAGIYGDTPVQIKNAQGVALSNVIDISSQCAVKGDGTVWCWGTNAQQVPAPSMGVRTNPAIQIMASPGVPFTNAKAISSDSQIRCIIKTDKTLWCWNWNGGQSFGINSAVLYPVQIYDSTGTAPLTNVVSVDADMQHTCAIDTHTQVWCFGDNLVGELGNGVKISSIKPVAALDPININNKFLGVKQVAAGGFQTCAVDSRNYLACWGMSDAFLFFLWRPWPLGSAWPLYVYEGIGGPLVKDVKMVGTFMYNSCYVKLDGTAWCWGMNQDGQLGDGTQNENFTTPQQVRVNGLAVTGITDIAIGGDNYACAIWRNNQVGCWGRNSVGVINGITYHEGNLGNGVPPNMPNVLTPTLVTFP